MKIQTKIATKKPKKMRVITEKAHVYKSTQILGHVESEESFATLKASKLSSSFLCNSRATSTELYLEEAWVKRV